VISLKSGQPRVRETSFAWGSTVLKMDMDRCKTRPSQLRPSGSDTHDVKSPSTSARSPKGFLGVLFLGQSTRHLNYFELRFWPAFDIGTLPHHITPNRRITVQLYFVLSCTFFSAAMFRF
jgi:hypothetical protein